MANSEHHPFRGDPFGSGLYPHGPTYPPIITTSAPLAKANTLATLSAIFAFLFAPVGAVLGHLALSDIRRTGQSGRARAVLGLAVSYTIIVATVVTIIVWLIARPSVHSVQSGRAASTSSVAGPVEPHVNPADLAGLLFTADELTTKFTRNGTNLVVHESYTSLTQQPGSVSPSQCLAALSVGDPRVYDPAAVRGYQRLDFKDTSPPGITELSVSVTSFDTAGAAAAQRHSIAADWQNCTISGVTDSAGRVFDTGHGLYDAGVDPVVIEGRGAGLQPNFVHELAAKANVVVDVLVTEDYHSVDVLPVAQAILAKIPG